MKNSTAQSGQSIILALVVLTLVIVSVLALISGSFTSKQNSRYTLDSLDAATIAEAGIDKAVATLNKTAGQYNGETETKLGNGSYVVKITSLDANSVQVESTGYVPNIQNYKSKKTVSVKVERGDGMAFAYGIQVGDGGFTMSGGSRINGSVYSNNDINISGGSIITGDAFVAGGTQPTADQQSTCTPPNCQDYLFGKTISGNTVLDVAQSFRPTSTAVVNKVAVSIKKIGSPPNLTVRILGDNNGKPNKNDVRTSGTLNANLVSSQYGMVEIGLLPSATSTLTANSLYWLVIDTSTDATNYWSWQMDSLSGYTNGSASYSPNWQSNGNPVWNSITGDFLFKVYMGGKINKIAGIGSSTISGNAYANTLTGDNPSALQIGTDAYYQTESSIRVAGQPCSGNTHCHPSSPDLPALPLPVSDSNIAEWKALADDVIQTGDVNIQWPCTTTLEKKKYVGNVTIGGGCSIQIDTPVWITGNLSLGGGSSVKLKSSYGSSSGIIVVDGVTNLAGGSTLKGSGTAGSYMMVISTNTNLVSPYAISINGGNSSSILYAPYGAIYLSGGSNLREASAYKVVMDGGAILTYETGVANPFFSSGPSGSFSVVKGTYQSK
jgi:Tfp pilus assembly protein PilX